MIDNSQILTEQENLITTSLPKQDEVRHRIVFSYEEDEHMPVLLGWSHGLKEKNLFMCRSSIVSENEDDLIVKKTINKEISNISKNN